MIAIIDNYDSFTYNLYQQIAMLNANVKVFRNDKITIVELRQLPLTGLIISPGPGRPESAGISVAAIQAFAPHIPVLGVCLGHQAMAIAFGGQVVSAREIVHGKSTLVFHQQQNVFSGLPLPFSAGRYHSLIVEKSTLPETLTIEAENETGLIMAIKHKDFDCFGIQFHPESILTPNGPQFLNNFIQLCQSKKYSIAC